MENRYKIIVSNKDFYREFELTPDMYEIKLGTGVGCQFRLYKDLFFESVELIFIKNAGNWSLLCADNLYLTTGDSRKLMTVTLNHGDIFTVKYQESDSNVFAIEFLIDFNDGAKRYERAVDISTVPVVVIGSEQTAQIRLSSPFIHGDLMELHIMEKSCRLLIKRTRYGVYHNGIKTENSCIIRNGDFFSVADFAFYYKQGMLWTEIRDDMLVRGLSYNDYPTPNTYPKFVRNTRIKVTLDEEKIEVLDPPAVPQKPKNNMLTSMFSSMGMLLTSGIMAAMGESMIFYSLISGSLAIITVLLGAYQSNRDFQEEKKNRIEKYTKYADNKRLEITEYRNQERKILERIYVDERTQQAWVSDFSSNLFDRRPEDDDFLKVRLGMGNIKPAKPIEYKKQERLEVEDDLQLIPKQIAEEFEELSNAPVVCDFKESNAVGIVGKEEHRYAIMKNIILDICTRQHHDDVQLFFVASDTHKDKVEWLRFLPHAINKTTNSRNIVCDDESKNRVFDYLYKELSQRNEENKGEHIIVFFYDEYGFQTHPISKFMNKLKEIAATFVFMADSKNLIPQGCSYLISADSTSSGYLIDTANEDVKTEFNYNSVSDLDAKIMADTLAPVYTEELSLEGSLTKNISLFELLGIMDVDDLDLRKRWEDSKVYQSMAAPIGVTKSGVVQLDLHDKAHGPHGLVAGTTGSGKSEILQTYILSVATLFHPYEVAFVIIDFKGGGMANQFRLLPHLLGAITNIDGKEINRSLKSIKAELKKRQRLFAEVDVNHIDKYIQKYKAGEVKTPMPHLILIVDEFAELKAEQPDFMDELISTARIGRSLGVHLILATQKPSGQVNEQIWSNSRFKLCLKVQTTEDSNEVLKSPLAAEIKEPGRAYLQVGNNEIFELFQSAYSGAPEKIADAGVKEFTLCEVDVTGKRTPVYIQKRRKTEGHSDTQLEALVSYINLFCEKSEIKQLESICLPPLPAVIAYPKDNPTDKQKKNGAFEIGLYDDPDNQVQNAACIDIDNKNTIFVGSSQYGKTNALQVLLREIATLYTPEEAVVYILDFGSMVFKNFEELNHVGGVVSSSEDEKLKNLFKLLHTEIAVRKEKLVSVGVSSYSAYVEAGYKDLPHIYLMIDNLTALIELYLEDDDRLLYVIREGIAVGISAIVANPQISGIGYRYVSNFANRIAFYCNDSTEYGNVFDQNALQPDCVAGRCVLEIDKRILECQTYLAFDGVKEIDRVGQMQELISEANDKYRGRHAKRIPFIPTVLSEQTLVQEFETAAKGYRIPIGLTYDEVEPFYIDISQLGIMGLCGKENTGHRNFVQHIFNTLEKNCAQYPVRVAIFDDVTRKFEEFRSRPIVKEYTVVTEGVSELLSEWYSILEARYHTLEESGCTDSNAELLLMIVQNNDVAKKINDDFDLMNQFSEILSRFRSLNVAFVFTNYPNASLPYDAPEPLRMIRQEQHLLYFENLDYFKPFEIAYDDIKANRRPLEKGDAFYIQDNVVTKLKMVKADVKTEKRIAGN